MDATLDAIWTFLNSPLGITAVAAVALYLLKRARERYPAWMDWEGTIVEAVKHAEKAIPDDAENKSLRRFNDALAYVLRVYQETGGGTPPARQRREIEEGIRLKHAELEAAGGLGPKSHAPEGAAVG